METVWILFRNSTLFGVYDSHEQAVNAMMNRVAGRYLGYHSLARGGGYAVYKWTLNSTENNEDDEDAIFYEAREYKLNHDVL